MISRDTKLVRNTRIKAGILSVIGALVVALVIGTVFLPSNTAASPGTNGSVAYPAKLQAIANSCGPTYRWSPSTKEYGIIPDAFYERYKSTKELPVPQAPMTLPVYGYMDRDLLPKSDIKYYSVQDDPKYEPWQILRAMYEYDTLVIWYLPASTTPDDEAALKKYASQHGNVMVLPWTSSDQFLTGRSFAFVTWGIEQSCQTLDLKVVNDYATFNQQHPVKHPVEAPVSKMTKYGVLPSLSNHRFD